MLRLVLDTDVIVAGLRSPLGASAALLMEADRSSVQLLASIPLAIEYEAKCSASEHWIAAGLTREETLIFVDAIIALVEPVKTYFLWRPQLNDPDDEMVLEAAVNGRADAIVTFNQRDFGHGPQRFGIELMKPGTAIRRIRK